MGINSLVRLPSVLKQLSFPRIVKLDEVNPTDDKGNRSSRNHQHFNPEAREMLQEHVKVLETLMSVSINQAMFEKFVEAKFCGTQQMTVFDI